jgi:hypothetical protein
VEVANNLAYYNTAGITAAKGFIVLTKESISLINFCYAQRPEQKVNGTKDSVLFQEHFCLNFTAYFRLQLLHNVPYFGTLFAKCC